MLRGFQDSPDVTVAGGEIAGIQLGETVGADLARAETFALPLLIVLLVPSFGCRAAWMPLVEGATAVLGTFLV